MELRQRGIEIYTRLNIDFCGIIKMSFVQGERALKTLSF